MSGNKTDLVVQAGGSGSVQAITHYLELFKLHLCLYIGLSAVFGHVMACQSFSFESLLVGILVLVLACGSAVLNNIQDRVYDGFFFRTRHRSLPQKKVPVFHAAVIAIVMIWCGLFGLLLFTGLFCFFWGGMALIAYNGLYTPLKKQSLLAIVPGTLCGMLPLLIGWAAAGKPLSDPHILMIMVVMGLWQIPHFFIILLKTKPSPSGMAGYNRFPCFTKIFSPNEIKLQILIWTSLYSLAILLFLLNGSIKNPLLSNLSGLNAVMIPFLVSIMVIKSGKWNLPFAFVSINLSVLFFMGAGIFDNCLL
ncbi:UbiA family prenyltransferase [Desulfobacula toluolica]|uniref:heme o synthase n=1 Tax=Desulfobacula toluolica (strain DSM 7467 / Tol2) TaxID=651182 RepID=K0NIQ6_DESTT|nr:UbiA family prenyltransferase [Desulfobacula toluolica]CCK79693.1 CtaB: predicted protoheme IX farnesyltransferase (cytochrome oxidase assembly factor) [Desulfobacula toluolica Tol2]